MPTAFLSWLTEGLSHFGLRLEVLVGGELTRPPRVRENVAIGDADAGLVRAKIVAP